MPDMTYGWARLTCEYLARLAFQKHGLRSVVYRHSIDFKTGIRKALEYYSKPS